MYFLFSSNVLFPFFSFSVAAIFFFTLKECIVWACMCVGVCKGLILYHNVQEVYEQQKELILLGERVVLATLGFELNVHHPYKPLVEAIKKFKVAQNALAQVAWNFVNDGYAKAIVFVLSNF